MKACSYCGQDVKDSCTVCPKCKRPITAPSEDVFPTLRSRKKDIPDPQAAAERAAQAALAPDDPEAELLGLNKQERDELRSGKRIAAAAYLGILFFLPLTRCKDKEYAYFHANQGLVILLLLAVGVVLDISIGSSRAGFTICAAYFGGLFYLMILGAIRGLQGKMIPLPLIGNIRLLRYTPDKR